MKFRIEFYENIQGRCPVQDFLEELKDTSPDDFAVIMAGLNKLKLRDYHRPPLSKQIGDGLYELRHVGRLNTRIFYFFAYGKRIIVALIVHEPPLRDREDGRATVQPQGLVAEAYCEKYVAGCATRGRTEGRSDLRSQ